MFEPLRGFRDYYPKDWEEVNENLFSKAREVAKSFGFREIEMPIIERTEFLTKKSGEEIKQQIFNIFPQHFIKEFFKNEKKDINAEELIKNIEMALRFDLTMPSIRMALKKYRELTKPIKWFYIAKNFRYEEPQKGRDREFFQIGVEIYGEKSWKADLEALNFAITFLNQIIKDKYKLKVNNRNLMEELIKNRFKINEKNKQDLYRLIDKVRKISEEDFFKEATKILDSEEKIKELLYLIKEPLSLNEFSEILNSLNLNEETKKEIEEQLNFLNYLSNKCLIEWDFSIVRGLDYYTGLVFEFYDKDEKYRSLGGGGRYNSLAQILGFNEEVPATGLALGPRVLEVFMKENKLWKEVKRRVDFFVIPISEKEFFYTYDLVEEIRRAGFVAEIGFKKGLTKNLNLANKLCSEYAIIIGENEIKENKLLIKNLKTGEEVLVNKSLFLERLKIDKIDNVLNDLLEERFKIVLKIKEIKKRENLSIVDEKREKEVIEKFNKGEFKEFKKEIAKKIIEESKKLQVK